jgi:hypothetical protein
MWHFMTVLYFISHFQITTVLDRADSVTCAFGSCYPSAHESFRLHHHAQ